MNHRTGIQSALVLVASSLAPSSARAQCAQWSDRFTAPGPDAVVHALLEFDDGSGPKLYAGGAFTMFGDHEADYLARFDGSSWSTVSAGNTNNAVHCLTVFDDGSGSALYAGGRFTLIGGVAANRIAKWNGSAWSPLGTGLNFRANALAVFDDGLGGGAALYVAGAFATAGGVSVSNVARWNGVSWSPLGSGTNGEVDALWVHDDGSGGALYAGGQFTTAGGATVNYVAKWNGSSWSALGTGMAGTVGHVYALTTFDAGSGPALYAGGRFTVAGGTAVKRIAKWNGSTWSDVGGGVTQPVPNSASAEVDALRVFDDGGGPALFVGGHFTSAGGQAARTIAKWNGAAWSGLGNHTADLGGQHTVRALSAFDDGSGAPPELYVAGNFTLTDPDTLAQNLARWDGAEFEQVVGGEGLPAGEVNALVVFDHDGVGGPSLFAGSTFPIGGENFGNVSRWDGTSWEAMYPDFVAGVNALLGVEDAFGAGRTLFAAGKDYDLDCTGLRQFQGGTWSWVGSDGFTLDWYKGTPVLHALAMYDDASGAGPRLYVGGEFGETTCSNPTPQPASCMAKFDGAQWSSVGGAFNEVVLALTVFDDGAGPALYAGGAFTNIGGLAASRVARWNGTAWSALGGGVNGTVNSLCVHDDGSGPALFVGGNFGVAGGVGAIRIARWDGATWSPLGSGVNGSVSAMTAFDDGSGPALFVGGSFTSAGGVTASNIAKWDGSSWSSMPGTDGLVKALAAYDDGLAGGPDLFAGGAFEHAGGLVSKRVAQWFGCQHEGASYCAGDDVDPLVTSDCPCGNFGAEHHGCGNFPFTQGARMTVTGTTSPNTILFTCTDLPNNTLCTFLRGGNNVPAGFVFGDGVRCVQTPLLRFGQQNSGVGGNPPNTAITATLVEAPGVTRYYQCQYRNPVAGWCDPGLFNVSNGYVLQW